MRKPRLIKRCNNIHNRNSDCEICGDCRRAYTAKMDEYDEYLKNNPDKEKKEKQKPGIVTIDQTNKMLAYMRKQKDLRKFESTEKDGFCKKYNIKPMNFNFLISVVAAERIKKKGLKALF